MAEMHGEGSLIRRGAQAHRLLADLVDLLIPFVLLASVVGFDLSC
jgi:hypothetical protein